MTEAEIIELVRGGEGINVEFSVRRQPHQRMFMILCALFPTGTVA